MQGVTGRPSGGVQFAEHEGTNSEHTIDLNKYKVKATEEADLRMRAYTARPGYKMQLGEW